VRDALALNYQVFLLTDAVRAINVQPQDGQKAIDEMIQKGVKLITLSMIP
jgi:nicotinamidase/pyrazinamidase